MTLFQWLRQHRKPLLFMLAVCMFFRLYGLIEAGRVAWYLTENLIRACEITVILLAIAICTTWSKYNYLSNLRLADESLHVEENRTRTMHLAEASLMFCFALAIGPIAVIDKLYVHLKSLGWVAPGLTDAFGYYATHLTVWPNHIGLAHSAIFVLIEAFAFWYFHSALSPSTIPASLLGASYPQAKKEELIPVAIKESNAQAPLVSVATRQDPPSVSSPVAAPQRKTKPKFKTRGGRRDKKQSRR